MKAGQFNVREYLDRLYEEAGETGATPMMSGGEGLTNEEGILVPQENKKTFDWLKKEYQAGKTEVKVEINMGGASFEPGYDLQTNLDSVKDFKPGMFGEVKTADTGKKEDGKPSLDAKKAKPGFQKGEGDAPKKETSGPEKKEAPEAPKKAPASTADDEKGKGKEKKENAETEVKKIDLKTKKK